MPIIKSAIKRAKQSITRRSRNLQVKRAIKGDILALNNAIVAGDQAEINSKLGAAYSEIDRAVKKHTLHKNTAARRKSQLATAVAKSNVKAEEPKTEAPVIAKEKKAPAKKTVAKKTAVKPTAKKSTDK